VVGVEAFDHGVRLAGELRSENALGAACWLIQVNTYSTFSVVQIDSRTELVIAVDVAKRLGMSPQRVNVLATRPGFPKPLGKLGRSSVWRWSTVERWARDTGRLPAGTSQA
jgi:predicted DNA-binding transcriptional regulator AlpA